MVDLIREAQEDLSRERLHNTIKKTAPFLVGGVLLVLLGTAGAGWYQHYSQQKRELAGDAFFKAITQEESSLQPANLPEKDKATAVPVSKRLAAAEGFSDALKDSTRGYEELALFRRAALLAEAGKTAEAIDIYHDLASGSYLDDALRDLASLEALVLEINTTTDTTKLLALEQQLEAQTSEKNAWRYTARELHAFLALKKGDKKLALQRFEAIRADISAPEGINDRAGRIAAMLKTDVKDRVEGK